MEEGTMIEVYPHLFIGTEADYETDVRLRSGWAVIHACKEPYHRRLLGYTGRGAPKDHPEYLVARRGDVLFLNLVDTEDPAYVSDEIISSALRFMHEALNAGKDCLVHCNLGESRSPSLGLLYMAQVGAIPNVSLADAEAAFLKIYPTYRPKAGIRLFIAENWARYMAPG
jgi:hypothetical protein